MKLTAATSLVSRRFSERHRILAGSGRLSLFWPLGRTEVEMLVNTCIPVIPSANLEKSLRFWVDGLGLSMDRAMRQDGRLVGCMVHNERLYFWLNQRAGSPVKPEDYHGIQLYWAPGDIQALRERLMQLGYPVSEIVERDYGQTEFFVTDDDGYSHCFGVATNKSG
jgi:catechol 2,3-dioxygenase-like lactoylglutathione lyase family enzyme